MKQDKEIKNKKKLKNENQKKVRFDGEETKSDILSENSANS